MDGKVKKFRLNSDLKIPHMGWNSVYWNNDSDDDLMLGIEEGDQFYLYIAIMSPILEVR